MVEEGKQLTKHERKMLKQLERRQERESQHQSYEQQQQKKKRKKLITIVAIIAVVILGLYFMLRSLADATPSTTGDLLDYIMKAHTNVALHIHPSLEIEVLGEKQAIPANIGIEPGGMHVIHTHDATGELHIESPYPHQFSLKDFFTVWNRTFNNQCIFEYCVDEQHEILFTVNSIPNDQYENLPLRDPDKIRIIYKEK